MLNNYEERKEFLTQLKSKPCMDCGNLFPWYCMDFDHVPERGDKLFEINQQYLGVWTTEEVLNELEKCDLICSNCHRIRTHERPFKGGGSLPKAICQNGHDLMNKKNVRIENGKRKGCIICKRDSALRYYHNSKEGD